ncbi:23S rRNA (guanosine(2251)-2'-O)-methyltransferase RlmB [Desulfurivibrio alkaliphilus]|uniref:RNA methyltransferase, TrmH family, group 3 n=1 Tax=Desulfurivibrio alkaliphilus (strain DSM 19089 / UNIQEM U267 / AHT2) TaxID=589865 RepID=D6Z6N1_DESAT|nr:23S rRNA (guanosine(2251)-2'-O)-methyltransferase RlmB [Desulfurivibrio alkaliphilus]ADH84990.1 RNA methyltransferase, TrmH family, group 3 [Desulfurivibrio alkaliphilus AHT 2]
MTRQPQKHAPGRKRDAGDRNLHAATTAWGFHAVYALLSHRPATVAQLFISPRRDDQRIRELLELAARHGIPVHTEIPADLNLEEEISHQGVVARVKATGQPTLEGLLASLQPKENQLLLALDSIQDPRNLGAIIRTAAAFGADGLLIPKDRSAPLTGTVMKAAAGTLPLLTICRVTNLSQSLAQLKKHGFWIYGAGGQAPQQLHQTSFSGPICLVMGNEQKGLRPLVSRHCDHLVAIPMAAGVESLNVAVATGVILSEIRRQQN